MSEPGWDEILADPIDLIVLGSGAAGLTGALTAAIGGARVLLLEKSDLIGGTTSMSGGGVWIPCNHHTMEVGVEDSREEALEYLRACVGEAGEEGHVEALLDHGPDMIRLLESQGGVGFTPWPSIGGTIDYRPWLPGAKHGGRTLSCTRFEEADLGDWVARWRTKPTARWSADPLDYYAKRMHLQAPSSTAVDRRKVQASQQGVTGWGRGTGLVGHLLLGCLKRGVLIRTNSPARSLLLDDGRVVGATVGDDSSAIEVRSRSGVLVATGGFTNNEELKRLWLTRPLEYTCDVESNQGDGHLMGLGVGAQLAGLGDAWWQPYMPLGSQSGIVNAAGSREDRILPHTMMVNSVGRRFMNEAVNYYDAGESFGTKVGAAPRNYPAWMIFDQQAVDRYALLAWKVSDANDDDWLKAAQSIGELAEQLRVDPATLTATVERFNGFARSGKDEDFGRGDNPWDLAWGDERHGPNPCLGTLENGPFYAVPVYSGALATRGGLRVNAHGEVLAALTGSPIPGLYAAGNCTNGGPAGTYPGPGATLGAAMTFGYIVGQRVASSVAVDASA